MPKQEAEHWHEGTGTTDLYARRLMESAARKQARGTHKEIIKPADMPWEDSPEGRIKHLLNVEITGASSTVDLYILEIPPGGCSGKSWHPAEALIYVLEGRGYDLHWDVEPSVGERYEWKVSETCTRWDWEEGDIVAIPICTAHQHFNTGPERRVRLLVGQNRVYNALGWGDIEQLVEVWEAEPPTTTPPPSNRR
jgi:quercetin dioxygenase-like cupin family protein